MPTKLTGYLKGASLRDITLALVFQQPKHGLRAIS
ncbi:hypothetical protein J2T49_000365 [Pseudomonas nitroreducens]|nr:hypothetical protein [Pseudomonas nitroreducens]MCP1684438.1 hypothetical protein [Pseudomonas nitroreducens]